MSCVQKCYITDVGKNEVEVDYCPECWGVWLDRGELEKIAARMGSGGVASREGDRKETKNHSEHDRSHKKKKSSVFGDIFDMIGGGGDD